MTTDERKEAVRPLIEEHMASTQIARHFANVTRNAIIGFCHRHDIVLPNGVPKDGRKTVRSATPAKQKPKRAAPPKPIRNTASKPVVQIDQAQATETSVPFIVAVTEGRCKWPLWDDDQTIGNCCGAPRADVGSYCEHHAARSVGRGTEGERTAARILEKYA